METNSGTSTKPKVVETKFVKVVGISPLIEETTNCAVLVIVTYDKLAFN